MLHHIYNSNLSLLSKIEKKIKLSDNEIKDVVYLPTTFMICYLNGFEEAKQKLIDSKILLKSFENPTAYSEFKEIMRILRKIKYNEKFI
jgi:hypothetical protein